MNNVVLKSEKLNKYFGITHAVKDVSLEFVDGEIHGLIGENGSGKSTYCSMLCGIYSISSGSFFLNGEKLNVHSQVEANKQGISIIVQEIGTLPGLTVAENIYLGEEDTFMHGVIRNSKAMNAEAQRLLNLYGLSRIKASSMIDNYSFEDRKLIEIIKATYFDPQIVVVDETTTALSQSGREELFTIMDGIKAKGHTVIFISHDLSEVIEHTDRISVLKDGALVNTVTTSQINSDDLKKMMVGRELGNRYYRTDYGESVSDEVTLTVNNVSVPGEIENLSFTLHKGEILGFGGLSGCGIHEVGKAIFGASYFRTGSVTLANGTPITSIKGAIDNNIGYASKDRDNESIVVADTISHNICLPSLGILSKRGILKRKELTSFAQKYAQLMSIKMVGIDQDVADLSGGNKQKVVLARWLGKNSDILVLDSPTRGIDVMVKADIYALMSELKRKGKSIVMISEEIPELLGMSDRIIIMKDGKMSDEFTRSKDLGEEDLIANMV